VYLLSIAGLIACTDVCLFEAFSCPETPHSTFDKLRDMERLGLEIIKKCDAWKTAS
jgi:hypothetical protein